ncbi:Phosphatidylinositol 4-phosphate 5-kinase 8 (AtPIP5K8) (1-phosphatidylinositol 4-phosphate kinase 8) (Diphosphoinositide kinase 8) (PtdIns(4)P-5-kinase 8) [Durusdinium trenchii]|uniref:Phosphatidylinositol 4-phosphate 5-kinase 8 (AtPIP5K8) (1-phosphatidylinositol 4-phosphate kinase 8) (Diphosphoinositide kinase 8) (PtdIns(4)P-5-kinase 8) n=1 Tax=Durusdinium trenchii TaxID=1381693 RepID=A0ABP0NAI7_9DINO
MDAVGRALFSGHALTAAQTFVAGVSRPKKKRELTSDLGRKDFGFAHEEFDDESGFYEGTFKVRMRNGVGHLLEANSGASYSGSCMKGDTGTASRNIQTAPRPLDWEIAFKRGSYDGFWSHGEKHGQGLFQSSTGAAVSRRTYDGKWEESLKHGAGKQLYKNGDEYHGTWYQGQCSGKGVYYHANGAEFHGAWAAGKRHGGGMYFGPKGQKEHHIYQFGVLMERRILLPGSKPPRGHRVIQPMHTDQTLKTQAHIDMLKDTMFDSIPYMGHLSVKDSTLLDLSAPSIRRQQAAANVAEMKRASALLGRGPAVSCTALA